MVPADHLEFDLHFDLITGGVESGEITGVLRYSGPTAVVFDADGNVVGFELDSFNDSSFKLTRTEPDPLIANRIAAEPILYRGDLIPGFSPVRLLTSTSLW